MGLIGCYDSSRGYPKASLHHYYPRALTNHNYHLSPFLGCNAAGVITAVPFIISHLSRLSSTAIPPNSSLRRLFAGLHPILTYTCAAAQTPDPPSVKYYIFPQLLSHLLSHVSGPPWPCGKRCTVSCLLRRGFRRTPANHTAVTTADLY